MRKTNIGFNGYIWSLERWYWWTYLQGSNGDTNIENSIMFPCYSLNSSYPLLPPLCLLICSLCLHLYCCPANRFISTIFLDSMLLLLSRISRVWLCVTLWTVACQAPLPMGFSKQEYWSRLPFPSPEDLPNPGIERVCPALQVDSLPPIREALFPIGHIFLIWKCF